MVLVNLLAATICFAGQCYPALVGTATPPGEYSMFLEGTKRPGYGGDILVFAEDKTGVFAIHRVYLLNPIQHREERLHSGKVSDRLITMGCVNIDPEIYEKLKNCCSNEKLVIK